MSEQVLLALIVAVPIVTSAIVPTAILMLNIRSARKAKEFDADVRKREKEEDYARADLVEERRKKEATDLLARQDVLARKADEAAVLLKTNTAAQAIMSGELRGQIQQVHTLVNSNLTEEMEQRLVVMQTGLAAQIEIAELRKNLGQPESETAVEHIRGMREKISALSATLEVRHAVTDAAAVEKRVTATATQAATAALTASGPLEVTIKQDETNPVPVKPVEPGAEGKPSAD